MKGDLSQWPIELKKASRIFLTEELLKAVTFLLDACNPNAGWGGHNGLPSDLHHSALAIQALYKSGDQKAYGPITNAAVHFRNENLQKIESLSISELANLLFILICEQQHDKDFTTRILTRIETLYLEHSQRGDRLAIPILCRALMAVNASGNPSHPFMTSGTEELINSKNLDGSWSVGEKEPSSIIATALALRFLLLGNHPNLKEILHRALQFLQKRTKDEKWYLIAGDKRDVLTMAMTLLAMARATAADKALLQEGINFLIEQINEDGGWGGAKGEPSNIECTALCISALLECEVNRFVPTSLAEQALRHANDMLQQSSLEINQFQMEFDKRLRAEVGNVVQERDNLRKEKKELQKRVEDAMSIVKNAEMNAASRVNAMERELDLIRSAYVLNTQNTPLRVLARLRDFAGENIVLLITGVILLGSALALQLIASKFVDTSSSLYWIIFAFAMIILVGSIGSFINVYSRFLTRRRRIDNYSFREIDISDDAISSRVLLLRRQFLDITDSWPTAMREEVFYRLFKDLPEIPRDRVARYIQDISMRLGLPPHFTKDLKEWGQDVARLQSTDRLILLDQLRRLILR